MKNKNIIIFDICGTLYNSNTTMDFCEYRSGNKIKKIILKLSKTLFFKIFNKILVKVLNYDLIRILHIKSLKGVTKSKLEKDAYIFVENFLVSRKIFEVHKILEKYNDKQVFLVSATIEPLTKAISKKLGGLKYFSTTLEYQDDTCLGKIRNDLLGNKQKYFMNKQVELIITDNKSDLLLCQIAKELIIVSNNKNLNFWRQQNLKITKFIKV